MNAKYKYGHFNESGDEFIITAPNTPRPFDNFLFNTACYANLHQTGIGYFDYQKDGKEGIQLFTGIGRVCDYDAFGKDHLYSRIIYVRDNHTGEFWAVNWEPVNREYEEYTCTHGLGYTVIMNKTCGIRSNYKIFIPQGDDPVELWELCVQNESLKDKNLTLFVYNQIQFKYKWDFDSYGDMIYRTTWMDTAENTFFAQKHPFIKPHDYLTAFFAADRKIDGYDGSRISFTGPYDTLASPEAVKEGRCKNSNGSADATICALQFNLTLKAGKSEKVNLVLGAVHDREEALKMKSKYINRFNGFLNELVARNQELAAKNEINTPDEHLNRMNNYWCKQATLFGSTWCRWGYNGYRDIVQHGFGVCAITPERTKEILREAFKHQYASGMSVRGWNPVDEKAYSDSALWLEFTLNAYLRETGDMDFLNEKLPFFDGGQATVSEHIECALEFFEKNKGSHGLLLIKYGDWNDSLTGVGKEGRGESVWLSIAYAQAMTEMAELAGFLNDEKGKNAYLKRREDIVTAVNQSAWDGAWYKRCYTDSGRELGSKDSKYAKIFIEPQCWALIAGVADKERADALISSMDEILDTPVGYQLLAPAFMEFDPEIGRITSMEPGIAENGTIYSHTNAWMILGLLKYGMADKAYDLFKKITPGYVSGADADIKANTLPFQYANCYFGPDHKNNAYQMEYSWITGSVAWFANIIETAMLGIAPGFEGLTVNPCLPSEFEICEFRRLYRNAVYKIKIHNPGRKERGEIEIVADGKEINGNTLPVYGDGKEHEINVVIK